MRLGERFTCDDSHVPAYELPALLQDLQGEPVGDAAGWRQRRRPEILNLLEQHVYGVTPKASVKVGGTVLQEDTILRGTAVQSLVLLTIQRGGRRCELPCLVYFPAASPHPVPVFAGLNFSGLHTVTDHPSVPLPGGWVRCEPDLGAPAHRASESGRGGRSSRWPIASLMEAGFGLATVYCGDIAPMIPTITVRAFGSSLPA